MKGNVKKKSPFRFLGPLLVLAVFCGAAWPLYKQLQRPEMTWQNIGESLLKIPVGNVVLALGVTLFSYCIVLVGYDYLACRLRKVPMSLARIAFAAITTYPFSLNFNATITGIPLRYRLYSSWGVSLGKIVQLLVILGLTFWFGVFFIAGLLFVIDPLKIPSPKLEAIKTTLVANPHIHQNVLHYWLADSRPLGCLLLTLTALYMGASLLHRGSVKVFRWTLPVPQFRLTVCQVIVASADMLVAAVVLYVLLPPFQGGYVKVLEVYLVAYVLIVLSHVPGGWGVLEAVVMTLADTLDLVAKPDMPKVLAGIIAFRAVYYLLPLVFGAALLGWHEFALWRKPIAAVGAGTDSEPLAAKSDSPADGSGASKPSARRRSSSEP